MILLVLLPAIALAFWPGYFSQFGSSPFAFHAHGLTATAWILLVLVQSWTAHARRFDWHRATGRLLLVAVPLFAAGAALAVHSMAIKFVTRADPFYAALGARLGMDDLIATTALVLLVRLAVINRRRAALHAGYMLATVLLVLSPIMARLPLPRLPHLGEAVTIAIALAMWAMAPRAGRPFQIVATLSVIRALQFETVGASETWGRLFGSIAPASPTILALVAMLLATLAIWTVWPWKRREGRSLPTAG
jgi:hypothetical protein